MPKTKKQEFSLKGEDLLKKAKELLHEGNIRRITILDKNDKTIVEMPLTLGVVGSVIVPPLAIIGVIAALVSECTIRVEKE